MKRSNYISVSIVLLALFSMLSCGDNIPEYKLLKIEKPKISANGRISPTQNLEYFIEIDHPLQNDSLELLQNHYHH